MQVTRWGLAWEGMRLGAVSGSQAPWFTRRTHCKPVIISHMQG